MKKLLLLFFTFLLSFCSIIPKNNDSQKLSVLSKPPVFPGCEELKTNKDLRNCFQNGISQHIKNNFKHPEIAKKYGIEATIVLNFIIDTTGKVSSAKVIEANFDQKKRIFSDGKDLDLIEEAKDRRYYEKPCAKRRRLNKRKKENARKAQSERNRKLNINT